MPDEMLVPTDVLQRAVGELRAAGHDELAEHLAQVQDYMSDLAAAHAEVLQILDALLQRTPDLLTPRPRA
jgi:hypothetical protein